LKAPVQNEKKAEEVHSTPYGPLSSHQSPQSTKIEELPLKLLTGIEVDKKIGSGNFGIVFSGFWNKTPVALKSLKADNEEGLKEIIKEASAMLSVSSPNIVQTFGYYKSDDTIYIVMEFMSKGNLLSVLRDGTHTAQQLNEYVVQCALPLIHIHASNFVHRDIAARNYLVSDQNKIKLSDFGLAKQIEEENYYEKKEKMLPIRWCAPEVLLKRKFSTKSDVWAFGITVFEIYSEGEVPFSFLDNDGCLLKLTQENLKPERPEKCKEEVWNVISLCFLKFDERPPLLHLLPKLAEIFEIKTEFDKVKDAENVTYNIV